MFYDIKDLQIAVAVNENEVYEQCLSASPDIHLEKIVVEPLRGFNSAAKAYNSAIKNAKSIGKRILILPHQDVYLPKGFCENLISTLQDLSEHSPDWMVAGAIGCDLRGQICGETWISSQQRVVGERPDSSIPVQSLDEFLIILNLESNLLFDEELPGFHLFGTDIVQQAIQSGGGAYVVPTKVIHHSKGLVKLGLDYAGSYFYSRNKWKKQLPVQMPILPLEIIPLRLLKRDIQLRIFNRFSRVRPLPAGDPRTIAKHIGYETE